MHLNPNAQCGYLGVSINVNSKGPESAFRVIFRTKHIGYYPTAVAGAVAYARGVLEYEHGADAAAAASSSKGAQATESAPAAASAAGAVDKFGSRTTRVTTQVVSTVSEASKRSTVSEAPKREDKQKEKRSVPKQPRSTAPQAGYYDSLQYDAKLLRQRVRVFWKHDRTWFVGVVREFDPVDDTHTVAYDDGDVVKHHLNDPSVQWRYENESQMGKKGKPANLPNMANPQRAQPRSRVSSRHAAAQTRQSP